MAIGPTVPAPTSTVAAGACVTPPDVIAFKIAGVPWSQPNGVIPMCLPRTLTLRHVLPMVPLAPPTATDSDVAENIRLTRGCIPMFRYTFGGAVDLDISLDQALSEGQTIWIDHEGTTKCFKPRVDQREDDEPHQRPRRLRVVLGLEAAIRSICKFMSMVELFNFGMTCQDAREGIVKSGAWLEDWDTSRIDGAAIFNRSRVAFAPLAAIAPRQAMCYSDCIRARHFEIAAISDGALKTAADVCLSRPVAAPKLDIEVLHRGHLVDALDTVNDWYPAVVLEVDRTPANRGLKISYWGWTAKWDEWIAPKEWPTRLAIRGTKYTHWFVPRLELHTFAIDPMLLSKAADRYLNAAVALCCGSTLNCQTSAELLTVRGQNGGQAVDMHLSPLLNGSQLSDPILGSVTEVDENPRVVVSATIRGFVSNTVPVPSRKYGEVWHRFTVIVKRRVMYVQHMSGNERSNFFVHRIDNGINASGAYLQELTGMGANSTMTGKAFLQSTIAQKPPELHFSHARDGLLHNSSDEGEAQENKPQRHDKQCLVS